jgi:cell division protein FtsZ
MSIHFNLEDNVPQGAVIKVVGVGGGGGNAVDHMVRSNLEGVEFVCANTDAQALRNTEARVTIRLGETTTKGLGAGANPEVGRQAAIEDRERLAEVLGGADMVFITAGMGGGTGTGAAPIIAEVARELGILTIAVVTRPFSFEGGRRSKVAKAGIEELRGQVDSLITIPNDKLLSELGDVSVLEAFEAANNVLHGAVRGIADLITNPGKINVDFADVRTVMGEMGVAMMGSGRAKGENRAVEAAKAAISSPLLDNVDLHGARGILVNVTGSSSLGIKELNAVGDVINEFADGDANIIMGLAVNEEMNDELSVTVVATGIGQPESEPPRIRSVDTSLPMGNDGRPNWNELDKAAIERRRERQSRQTEPTSRTQAGASASDVEDLIDIPTFLRRQAD